MDIERALHIQPQNVDWLCRLAEIKLYLADHKVRTLPAQFIAPIAVAVAVAVAVVPQIHVKTSDNICAKPRPRPCVMWRRSL